MAAMPMSMVSDPQPHPPAGWTVREERRTISVLFADIVGSTALVERLDPEDVRALQRDYFDTVAAVLHRWQGVVEKYIGDAVVAVFGATGSDGYDAYRAVRAGLDIQRAVDRRRLAGGPAVRIRVGVATGEAVVDLAAARDGGHGAVSGAVVTTAARLQEYAPPGGVVGCAATAAATDGLVDWHPLPPLTVAGKPRPVDIWRAVAPAEPRPGTDRGGVALVGRRRELAVLREEVTRSVRERSPRWIPVVGPAGVGRSRLLRELAHSLPDVDGRPVLWCLTACPPHPDDPWGPVTALVRRHAGIDRDDDPATVRRRLTATLGQLFPAGRLAGAVDALAALLAGAPADAGNAVRTRLVGARIWREALLALAERQPVVVAVDDLDRAAPALTRFLHRLHAAARARRLPLAVVVTHRPEWADELRPGGPRVTVAPLRTVDTGRLLRHLLGDRSRGSALVARLLPLVGGNPGRAEAYARLVTAGDVDAGDPELPVPEPVRRAVAAGLDRLDGPHRAVLMAGATLPAGFTAERVARLLDLTPDRVRPLLRELAALGLVTGHPGGIHLVADPVLRRVAHDRLPRAVRAEFRRLAGAPDTVGELRPAVGAGAARRPAPTATAPRSAGPSGRRPVPPPAGPHNRPVAGAEGPVAVVAADGPAADAPRPAPGGPAAVAVPAAHRPQNRRTTGTAGFRAASWSTTGATPRSRPTATGPAFLPPSAPTAARAGRPTTGGQGVPTHPADADRRQPARAAGWSASAA